MSRLRTTRTMHKCEDFHTFELASLGRTLCRLPTTPGDSGIDDDSDWRWAHYYDRPLFGLRAVVSIDLEWSGEIKQAAFIAFMQDNGPSALRRTFDTIELHVRDIETAAMARLAL